jgi:hypothetical protein
VDFNVVITENLEHVLVTRIKTAPTPKIHVFWAVTPRKFLAVY